MWLQSNVQIPFDIRLFAAGLRRDSFVHSQIDSEAKTALTLKSRMVMREIGENA